MSAVPLRYSVRNLFRRPTRTLLTILGLSLLVGLIVFVAAFGRSFSRTLRMPGDPQNVIVLSKKAQSFEFSSIAASELDLMKSSVPEIEAGPDGDPLFSREVYHFVSARLEMDPEEESRRGIVLGIESEMIPYMLTGFRMVDGDLPEADFHWVIVGKAAAARLRAPPEWLEIGTNVKIRDTEFMVSGIFEAPGTLYENWIIGHPADLRPVLGRRDWSFARMRLRSGADVAAVARRISEDERFQVRALPETEYFKDFMSGFTSFEDFAMLLAVFLGIGGILTGMNTMHNAVAGRIREIGVLRVLGFPKGSVFTAFLTEALLLTGLAGVVGCGLGLLANGLPIRIPVVASFPLVVDGTALAVGFSAALLMGVLGLCFPMLRALRKSAVDAVRAV